jgi:cell division septation protein DedD
MVKAIRILLTVLITGLPALACAGEFSATVDHDSIAAGENFTLDLTLSNTQPKGTPDLEPLQKSFIIASQGQSSNTVIVNGKVTSSVGWELTLIPRTSGTLTIPSLSVATSDGMLSTQPIEMEVSNASAAPVSGQRGKTTVIAHASTLTPYKGQSLFYTVKIVARDNLADLSLGDVNVDNAIVQQQGKAKIYDEVENGTPVKVIEVRYIITPLAAGKITIPSMLLLGKIAVAMRDPFANAFNQPMADPFGMMDNMDMMTGFATYKPFSIASNAVQLDVKPATVAMDPWLPLTSLSIKDDVSGTDDARVGDPINRKITLVADGAVGKQLPDLDSQQNHADFKVYADKPTTEESVHGETIVGKREESYSLIPLKAGKLVLPAIKVPWWDIKNDHITYAELPAKTIDVAPAAATGQEQPPVIQTRQQTAPVEQQQAAPTPASAPAKAPTQQYTEKLSPFYAVIAVLLLALVCAIVWAVRLRKKMHDMHIAATPHTLNSGPEITLSKPAFAGDLAGVKTAQELNSFIRQYAYNHWGTAPNASLESIFSQMHVQNPVQNDTDAFVSSLTAALYAGKDVDIAALKQQWRSITGALKKTGRSVTHTSEKLPGLNPN